MDGTTRRTIGFRKLELIMTREEKITHEAIEAAIADTGNGTWRDGYEINAIADHEQGFKEGFIEGARWVDRNPNWISVDDRLPKLESLVLCYSTEEGPFIGMRLFKKFWGGTLVGVDSELITHWMPLPKSPKRG